MCFIAETMDTTNSSIGNTTDSSSNTTTIPSACPPGMVYQQCGQLCPQTCNNIGISNCLGGCAEGCFCPDGQVFLNGRCVNPIACPGDIHTIQYTVYTHCCICCYNVQNVCMAIICDK